MLSNTTLERNEQLSLLEALEGMSKDELSAIRKNTGIKNASKLNREQLKLAIVDQLPIVLEHSLPSIFTMLDHERIQLLEAVVKKNGKLLMNQPLTEQQQIYWKQLGLLFQFQIAGQNTVYMPFECVEVVKGQLEHLNNKMIELNETLIHAVRGMMYYYGALSHEQLIQLIKRYPMFEQLAAEPMHIIINYRHYHSDFGLDQQNIYHIAIPDPSLILAEQAKRDDLDFAFFPITTLTKVTSAFYIERTAAHQYVVDVLVSQYRFAQHEAMLIADQCEFGIRAGLQLQDLVQYMMKELYVEDESHLNPLIPRLIIMFNQTTQWFLKGHSSNDLKNGQQSNDSKPQLPHVELGRNDLCYCGSGKKYKKCCMQK